MSLSNSPGDDPGQTSIHAMRAANGVADSLAWIVERYTPYLHVQAFHRMPRALTRVCDAEDLINDVWVSVMPRIASIEPGTKGLARALLSYLSTALLNRITSLSRSLAHGEPVRFEWKGDDGSVETGLDRMMLDTTGIVTRVTRSESGEILRELFDEMSEKDREVMLLRGLEQHTNEEVAVMTGEPENTVSKRYCRALEKVRARLPQSLLLESTDE